MAKKIAEKKRIILDFFEKVKWNSESDETFTLVLLCSLIFGASFFAGAEIMGDYGKKISQPLLGGDVLASESQESEDGASVEEDIFPEGKKVSETISVAAGSVKNLAIKTAKTRRLARQRAAESARLQAAPVPRAPTNRVNGKRVCEKKNDDPRESNQGSHPHMDMECCPDPDEWPNPHCHYTPQQLSRMLKPR